MAKAVVLCPYVMKPGVAPLGDAMLRYKEDEAASLASTLGLEVIHRETLRLVQPKARAFIGEGTIERLKERIDGDDTALIVNCDISPVQQRNLEKALQCKVLDRTAVILEIFAARASTKEGKLQVELASQEYLKTRLVRSWTHLERQRGGSGFLGGPGETQIESDRRAIRERIGLIRKRLEKVVNTRELHRAAREKVPYPVVALAGYTNAGKSTLFNLLTKANVLAEDKLFATLDPSLRGVRLPSGRKILFADTVGFISDLPTELVAAFRATLEEVARASLILHVRDVSCPMSDAQRADVLATLENIAPAELRENFMVEAWNKIDAVTEDEKARLRALASDAETPSALVSAKTGEGVDALLRAVDVMLGREEKGYRVSYSASDGELTAWLYRRAVVEGARVEGEKCVALARLSDRELGALKKFIGDTGRDAAIFSA